MTGIMDSPDEILRQIASYLPYKSLRLFSRSNIRFCQVIRGSIPLIAKALIRFKKTTSRAILYIIPEDNMRVTYDETKEFEGKIISALLDRLEPNIEKQPFLIAAITSRHEPAIRLLVEAGANLYHPESALIKSTEYGCMEVSQLLFDLGLDPKHETSAEALFFCLDEPDVLTFLLESGVEVKDAVRLEYEERLESPLVWASKHNNSLDAVNILLDAGADIDFGNGLPLYTAISEQADEIVKCLIERGADLNLVHEHYCGETAPLETACDSFNSTAFFLLVDAGADHLKHAANIICLAAQNNMLTVIRWMIDHGASASDKSYSEKILWSAIYEADFGALQYFLDAGARFVRGSHVLEKSVKKLNDLGEKENGLTSYNGDFEGNHNITSDGGFFLPIFDFDGGDGLHEGLNLGSKGMRSLDGFGGEELFLRLEREYIGGTL
ncbi:hypothetical protein HDU97_007166 [Phlyctochytrium planicorne]|nr:hypothetical protein HDU97_007166 [Phlyctochytrium planicorne]